MIRDVVNYIPKVLLDNIDASGQALIDKINNYVESWKNEIIELKYLKQFERMPAKFLDEMNAYLEAEFNNSDSETIKRGKVQKAVANHKLRTTWVFNVKIITDRITGKNASLYKVVGEDDAIFYGDGTEDGSYYYNTWGGDGIDNNLGKMWIGFNEVEIAGVVYIDLGYTEGEILYFYPDDSIICGDGVVEAEYYSAIGSSGTFDYSMAITGSGEELIKPAILTIIDELKLNLKNFVPAYFKVYFGYVNDDSLFVILGEVI